MSFDSIHSDIILSLQRVKSQQDLEGEKTNRACKGFTAFEISLEAHMRDRRSEWGIFKHIDATTSQYMDKRRRKQLDKLVIDYLLVGPVNTSIKYIRKYVRSGMDLDESLLATEELMRILAWLKHLGHPLLFILNRHLFIKIAESYGTQTALVFARSAFKQDNLMPYQVNSTLYLLVEKKILQQTISLPLERPLHMLKSYIEIWEIMLRKHPEWIVEIMSLLKDVENPYRPAYDALIKCLLRGMEHMDVLDVLKEWKGDKDKDLFYKLLGSYHSCFVCPITKEHETEDNPTYLLECGHVLSKNALDSIDRTHCPYCRVKTDVTAARPIIW